jgi:hypothetical protein
MSEDRTSHMPDLSEAGRIIAVKMLQTGQPRAYADSVYEAEITFTGKNISTRPAGVVLVTGSNPPREFVEKVTRLLVHDWDGGWGGSLTRMEKIQESRGHSTWAVKIVVPYTD